MSDQTVAANTSVAAPATKTHLHWRKIVANAELPAEASALITTVIKRARLWRSEAREVAIELVAHFQDGLVVGRTASELATTFGNPKQAAKLIHRGKARCRPLWWQAWWWCSRGLLVLLAVYLLLVLWQLWAQPEIKVNYLDIINKPALAVPEADRAWPYYRDAYMQLGLHNINGKPHTPEKRLLQKIFADSWRPGNKEWPAMVTWLEQHRPALEKVRQGTSKPGYGLPSWIDRSKYSAGERKVLNIDNLLSPEEIAQAPLYSVTLSQLDINRRLTNILSSDAIRAAKSGDAATALADIEGLLGLSRQTEETPFVIGGLVAMSINSIALQTTAEICYAEPQLWSSAQLQQLAHRLAGQQFHPENWLQHEQYFFLDLVQRVYSDDGQGDGRLTLAGLKNILEIELLVRAEDRLLKSMIGHNEKSLQIMALPALNIVAASRKEITEHYQQLLDRELTLLHQPYWQCEDQLEEIEQKHFRNSEKLRYSLSAYCFPAVRAARMALTSHQGRKDGLLIGIAFELYHREHGIWPEALEQLSPRYLPTLPVDQLTGKPLQYRLSEGKPVVYSVGQNLKDDGGLLYQPSDEMDYRYGYYDQGINDTVADEPSDWILWSLVPEHQRSLPPEPEPLDEEHEVDTVPSGGEPMSIEKP